MTVKTGTLVYATIIASAGYTDARWVKRKGKRAVHGFKAHVAAVLILRWSRRSRSPR